MTDVASTHGGLCLNDCIPLAKKDGDTFLPVVYLEWIDSASYSSWQDVGEAEDLTPYYCRSFGLLVRETEEALVITHTETYGLGKGFRKMCEGLLSIPTRAITRRMNFVTDGVGEILCMSIC
jgi:hypothetical protein